MIGAVGYWESNERSPFSGRIADFGRWVNQLYAFGLDALLLIGAEGAKTLGLVQSGAVVVSWMQKLEEASITYPQATRVFVEHRGIIPGDIKYEFLHNFNHPQGDVIYFFGADSMVTGLPVVTKKDKVVTISYPHEDVALYAQEALTCVLYDRMVKSLSG